MNKIIVFATNNAHKLQEVRSIIGDSFQVLSLKDICCMEEIPETADTLEGNALLKSKYVHDRYNYDCFADDTGLEVEALNNAPGVFSARYAGSSKSDLDNMKKLLHELKGKSNRCARFRTVISLILDGENYFFEGIVKGKIIDEAKGNTGFGYDPVFVPDGYIETFAELGNDIKNKISHRAEAVNKLKRFLDEKYSV
jgi:non-canonical purine NTP pyrophosphatase, rdgB/HAM1 family